MKKPKELTPVGFWRDSSESTDSTDTLPFPKLSNNQNYTVTVQKLFLQRLALAEQRAEDRGGMRHYKGPSKCRICGSLNGSSEFTYHHYTWPSGYSHYIRDHGVAPNKMLYTMLVKYTHKQIPVNDLEMRFIDGTPKGRSRSATVPPSEPQLIKGKTDILSRKNIKLANKLEDIATELRVLLMSATALVVDCPSATRKRAEAYWLPQIRVAVGSEGDGVTSSTSMLDTIAELRKE